MEQWATEDERKESCQSRERKSFKRVGWQSMKTVRRWKLLSTNGWVEMCTTAVEFGRHRCHLAVGRGERPVLSKSLKKIAIPRKWRPRSSPPPSFSSIAFLSLSSSTTLRWLKFSPPPLPRTVESSERDCKIACLTLQRRPTNTVIPFSDTRFHPPSFFQSCPPLIMIFWENKDDVCLLLD